MKLITAIIKPFKLDDVRAALDDDLDCPGALAAIDEAAQAGYNVASAAALLGITL